MCFRSGLDLVPALNSQGEDGEAITADIAAASPGTPGRGARMPKSAAARALSGAGRVMNIAWIEDALAQPARIICPRSSACPRTPACEPLPAATRRAADLAAIRQEIIAAETAEA